MQASSTKITYLLGGTFARTQALTLGSSDAGESWLAYPGQTPILDGGTTVNYGITLTGGVNNVTIRWLTIQNFSRWGIWAQANDNNLLIDSNTIQNNAGGILQYGGTNGQISRNLVRNCTGFGISAGDYYNSPSSNTTLTGMLVEYNMVLNTMTSGSDGGAIYFVSANHTATGVVINNNVIGDWGSTSNQSKVIYLDDNVSGATVTNNIAYGTGQWGLAIHGGDNNVFKNNIFNLSGAVELGLYQSTTHTDYGMGGNIFTCNIVYSSATPPSTLWQENLTGGIDVGPSVTTNLYYDTIRSLPNTSPISDSNPTVANPGFVNPGQANYGFQSAPPTFCSFSPIDTSQVGPLPN